MNTVMFDLDGTLLPIDEERFTKSYFKELSAKMARFGFEPGQLIDAVWAGTKAMVKNDGGASNKDVFWARFQEMIPCDIEDTCAKTDAFYLNEFDRVKGVVGDAAHSAGAVRLLRKKGYRVVLATNPIFPMVAVETRLRWLGLSKSEFEYITTYENSRFTKPNPCYYQDILDHIGAQAGDCLMVGNNAVEDMAFAELDGQVFLLTDHLENPKGVNTSAFEQGGFPELMRLLDGLPAL